MRTTSLSLCAALLAACQSTPQPKAGEPALPPAGAATTSATAEAKAEPPTIDVTAMDRSVDPCSDFYQYACGGWLKSTPIPEDRAAWGRGFAEINQRNEVILRDILERNARGEPDRANPFWQKTGDYYAACMDEEKAESMDGLRKDLAAIDAIKDANGLAREVARLHQAGGRPFFSFSSQQDYKDATLMIGGADQSGLGLPDRDYYLKDDQRMKDLRALYQDHVAKMLQLAGAKEAEATKQARTIMDIEMALAKASQDKVERRDPNKVYHRLERAGLKKAAPHFQWDLYFAGIGTPDVQQINVVPPEFFPGLDAVLTKHQPPDLRAYLRLRAIERAAPTLGKAFVAERFRFVQALTGQKVDRPRWKKCVAFTDTALGEALGRSFVEKTLGDQGKAIAKEMVERIEGAFTRNLDGLDWMDAAAKSASLDKVRKIRNKIGYPEKWRDYSSVQIGRDSFYDNAIAAARFESARELAKIGKPVDRGEWQMSPPMVNAYYDPSLNEMVFPAGILQSPFFKPDAPARANYGGLGMVMGHELTHGFDDEGRQFDGDDNLHEWWSAAVNTAFNERAACVAKQYDNYLAVEDVHLNGKLTLGENIADIGGLKMALAAYRAKRGGPASGPQANGLSDEQQFFVAFAQTWCTNYRPQAARLQAQTNPHSTAQWRVNGPVSDNAEFEKAFQCRRGSPMAPQDRCTVW